MLADLESTDSLEELQTHIIYANELFETEPEMELAAGNREEQSRLMQRLESWLDRVQEKVNHLAAQHGAASYSISMAGNLAGPSVSLSVTYQVESETNHPGQ